MYLIKNITTGYGLDAAVWEINTVTVKRVEDTYHAWGNISLYFSDASRIAGSSILDNCLFHFTDLTLEEINSNTLAHLYNRVVSSNIINDVETNIYPSSISGEISFVNSQIVV